MASFPSPASNGQLYESNGTTYIYLSQYNLWQKYSVASNTTSITSNTATINNATISTSNTNQASVNNATINTSNTNQATINTANIAVTTSNAANINTANIVNINVSGNAIFNNIQVNAIYANGSIGTSGQVLASNGTANYWTSTSSLVGYTGSQGNIGYTGSQGIQGVNGYTGSIGATGNQGYTGSQGIQGNIGYSGSKGDTGTTGYTGSQGSQGFTGYTGSQGIQGNIGYTGSIGSKGDQGNIGYTGSQGIQGNIGYSGSKGDTGYIGSVGFVGSKGDVQPANVVFGDTAPSNPYTGLLWFDTNNAIFNAYYSPANNWIGINGGGFGPIGYTGSSGAFAALGYTGSQGIQANLLTVNTDIIPAANLTYNLGSMNYRWDALFVGSNSITFSDTLGGPDQVLSVANQVFYITQGTGTNTQVNYSAGFNAGGIILRDYSITVANTNQDITIGTVGASGKIYFNSTINVGNSVANSAQSAFSITNTGLTVIRNNLQIINPIAQTNVAPFTIQSQLGTPQPFTYTGTTLYSINSANLSNRTVYDSYGNGTYVSIAARTSRGTISAPTGLQANDIILRISANGYRTTGFGSQGSARIDFRSIDSFSDVQNGSQIDFWTTPLGSNVITEVATVTAAGITSTSFTAGYGTQNTYVSPTTVSTNNIVLANTFFANGTTGLSGQILTSSGANNASWQWGTQSFVLGSNLALSTATVAQSLFGVGATVSDNSRYAVSIQGTLYTTGGGPAGAGNLGLGFDGTANLSYVYYQTTSLVNNSENAVGQTPDYAAFRLTSGFIANSSVNSIQNFNKSYCIFELNGIINVVNGGTLVPQVDISNSPTTLTLLKMSSVSIQYLGPDSSSNSVSGTWA
jgi:Collagen triple helix repeat (20 copies)